MTSAAVRALALCCSLAPLGRRPAHSPLGRRFSALASTCLVTLLTGFCLLAGGQTAAAQTAVTPDALAPPPATPADSGDAQIRSYVQRMTVGGNRVEVQLGHIDPGIQLAPCARIEPFVPSGVRLWGRSTIGVRCTSGANWSVSLPVTVAVFGNALVAVNGLTANSAAAAINFRTEEIDLTRESGQLVTDSAQLQGKVMARPITAGQPLRADHLRVLQTIAAGDPVRIQIVGSGFSVSADGVALNPGGNGQALRVRMENGKILAGTVKDGAVEVRL